jgi:hypothetical protein
MKLARLAAALRRHPLLADVTLAAALAALAVVTALALVVPRAQVEPPSRPVIIAWAVALTAPLVIRRRVPLVVLVVTTVHFTRYWAVGQVNEIASWVVLGVAARLTPASPGAWRQRSPGTWRPGGPWQDHERAHRPADAAVVWPAASTRTTPAPPALRPSATRRRWRWPAPRPRARWPGGCGTMTALPCWRPGMPSTPDVEAGGPGRQPQRHGGANHGAGR